MILAALGAPAALGQRIVESNWSLALGGVAVDAFGGLWYSTATSPASSIEHIYDYGGGSGTSWGTQATLGQVAFGPDGRLWVVDHDGNKIWRVDPATLTQPDWFAVGAGPTSIAKGPDGNMWFTEEGAAKIGRLTPSGVLTEFLTPTLASHPTGITAAGPYLFYTEHSIGKIARITTAGVSKEYVIPRANPFPTGIAAGYANTVVFAETGTNRVSEFSWEFEQFYNSWVVPTPDSGVTWLFEGPRREIWFTENTANKIGVIHQSTNTIKEYDIPTPGSGPAQIAYGGDDTLFFAEKNGKHLARLFMHLPGDVNLDDSVDVADVFYLINYLFAGGAAPKTP
jgi:streptogramin lyase